MNTAAPVLAAVKAALVLAVAVPAIETVDLERFVDVLEESSIECRQNYGGTIVYKAQHPVLGSIVLVNTTSKSHSIVKCS